MCYTIKPNLLLANYFVRTRNAEISFGDLKNLSERIEDELGLGVYVDICSSSVFRAVSLNSKLWEIKHSDQITITEHYREFIAKFDAVDYVDHKYNWQIPTEIKERLIAIISNDEL